jgi:uncharacterized membrane protein
LRRISAIDTLRGFIMAVMAIDHVSGFVARRHPEEFWGGAWTHYESAAWFPTRCASPASVSSEPVRSHHRR